MLLLTLLPLAGWAKVAGDAVKVGPYTFTLSSKLVVLQQDTRAAAGATAPEILSVDPEVSWEPGRIYDANGQIVEDEVFTEVGNYFRQVTLTPSGDNATPVSVFVPFTVGKQVDTEIVWNEQTYQYSQLYGFEKQYHLAYPTYDVWDWETKAKKDEAPSAENGFVYSIEPLVRGTQYGSLFDSPFVGFVVPEGTEGTYHLGVKVQGVTKGFMRIPLAAETTNDAQNYMFWTFAATGNVNHPTDGGFLFATLMGGELSDWRFSTSTNLESGITTINKYNPETTSYTEANYVEETMPATAEWDEGELEEAIGFYLVAPQDPFNLNVTLTNSSLAYQNTVLNPGLRVFVGETQISPKSDTNADGYEVTWYKDGEASQLIDPGYYMGVVTYAGKVAIVDFTITKAEAEVILNPAYVEKTYGDNDPAPKFKQEGGQIYGDIDEEIMPFLVLKRSDEDPVATREDVGDHKYYIDFTPEYRAGKCNYEITILQNHSILKIIQRPLNIQVTAETATKEYKKGDPEFKYVVDNGLTGQLQRNDAEKATGTPSATDIITSITREKAGTDEGNDVGEYAFTATSKNYAVTVTNPFVITPATDLRGLKVQFAKEPNSTVYLDGAAYTYTGAAQEPAFKVIDTDADPDYTLQAGVDYIATDPTAVVEGEPVYSNNTDVTTAAKVTVTLKGNYSGTVEGTFTIEKAELTVAARSYTAEPEAYLYDITGWVNGEDETSESGKNTDEVTYFKKPTSGVVTKGDEIESGVFELVVNKTGFEAKNYKFKAENGLLALNGTTPIKVKATGFKKQYDGVDVTSADLKDKIAVYDANNEPILNFDKNKLKLANGPIYEIAKAATGRKHRSRSGANDATGANEGYYDITLRGPSVIQGYTITWVGLEEGCEIEYRRITLKAADQTKVYGAQVPALSASVVPADEDGNGGLIGSDTEAGIGLVNNGNNGYYVSIVGWSGSNNVPGYWYNTNEQVTVYDDTTDPVTDTRYTIRPVCQSTNNVYGNYQVTTADGKLTVTKAKVLIAAADATKQFGTADPEWTITVTPADDGTPASVATVANMNGFWTIARTDKDAANGAGETVGPHKTLKLTLTNAGKNADNFNIEASTENGTLTITAAELKVKAHGQWINYGEEINLYDVEITKPSGDGTKVLKWNKVTTDATGQPIPLTDAQTAENNAIKALGHLEVLEGKMEIGTNYDAFKFVIDDANYVIAPDPENEGEVLFTNNTLLVYPLTVIPLDKDMLAEILTNKALTPKTLTKVLQDHQGCTVDVILPRRPMKANDWYAWVLPFEVKQRDIFTNDKWGYGAIEPLDEARTTDKSVAFSLTVQPIPANTPFIVKVDQDIVATRQLGTPETTVAMDEIIMRGVEIGPLNYLEENPVSGDESTVQFIGLYNETKPGDLDNSALTLRRYSKELPSSQWASLPLEWWPAASNVTLNRTYGYLQFPNANAAREAKIFIQEPDGSYTAINGVNADASVNDDAIYNLSGQRVNKAQKGIYIKDGKKVLVK